MFCISGNDRPKLKFFLFLNTSLMQTRENNIMELKKLNICCTWGGYLTIRYLCSTATMYICPCLDGWKRVYGCRDHFQNKRKNIQSESASEYPPCTDNLNIKANVQQCIFSMANFKILFLLNLSKRRINYSEIRRGYLV